MGLGKTIQVLAFLQKIIDREQGLHLLVLPTSLLTNWESEIHKFAPRLKYLIAHPSNSEFKDLQKITPKKLEKYNVVLTTYGFDEKI